jgi:hypothetical protein
MPEMVSDQRYPRCAQELPSLLHQFEVGTETVFFYPAVAVERLLARLDHPVNQLLTSDQPTPIQAYYIDRHDFERAKRDLEEGEATTVEFSLSPLAGDIPDFEMLIEKSAYDRLMAECVKLQFYKDRIDPTLASVLRMNVTLKTEYDELSSMFKEWQEILGEEILVEGFKKAMEMRPSTFKIIRLERDRFKAALEKIALVSGDRISNQIAREALK